MLKSASADIASHRLRREIISTLLGNDAINRGGPAFVIGMGDKSGARQAKSSRPLCLRVTGCRSTGSMPRLMNSTPGFPAGAEPALCPHQWRRGRTFHSWALKTGAAQGDLGEAVVDA
jgi:glutamate dehydrogenase